MNPLEFLPPLSEVASSWEGDSIASRRSAPSEIIGSPGQSCIPLIPEENDLLKRMHNLQLLFQYNYISPEEYEERRNQLVNSVTGTILRTSSEPKSSNSSSPPVAQRKKHVAIDPIVIPCEPPNDFSGITPERATKLVYRIDESGNKHWDQSEIFVRICSHPFSQGSLRRVFHMIEDFDSPVSASVPASLNSSKVIGTQGYVSTTPPPEKNPNNSEPQLFANSITYVAKFSKMKDQSCREYMKEAEMQVICSSYAAAFNGYHPPMSVEFNRMWLIHLTDRDNQPFACVEPYMNGKYIKHNNNAGFVSEHVSNTPQAFSHFTYEASGGELVIVDIQGVGTLYTDPQIHSLSQQQFGRGNLGSIGIHHFLSSHRCNAICNYLKLPPINPNTQSAGTMPSIPQMSASRIMMHKVESNSQKRLMGGMMADDGQSLLPSTPYSLSKSSLTNASTTHSLTNHSSVLPPSSSSAAAVVVTSGVVAGQSLLSSSSLSSSSRSIHHNYLNSTRPPPPPPPPSSSSPSSSSLTSPLLRDSNYPYSDRRPYARSEANSINSDVSCCWVCWRRKKEGKFFRSSE